MNAPGEFKSGVAEVRAVHGLHVEIACPHCYGRHTHQRSVLGSSSVLAGCHAGFRRCREYSVPQVAAPRVPRSGRIAA